MTYKC